MIPEDRETLDESPTDELPVLTELDVVELDAGLALAAGRDGLPAFDGAESGEPVSATGRFPLPDDLPDIEPFPDPDEEFTFLRTQILVLEATIDDKDSEIASLAERLDATRDAVERRDETERELRRQLAEAESARTRLEGRLTEAEALASRYADRVAELTSSLRTLEQAMSHRDAAFADLEAELIAREARVVERERALADAEAGRHDGASPSPRPPDPVPPGPVPEPVADLTPDEDGSSGAAPPPARDLESALARSREEAAALAAYVDCRRAHWLALEAQLEEHRERLRELEQEIEQRAERERREIERADAEARRAAALGAELARLRGGRGHDHGREPTASVEAAPTATLSIARLDAPSTAAGPKQTPDAALVCLTSDPPCEYPLEGPAMVIGRGQHCDIQIATHFVSREHARVVRERDQVLIEDLGSKNGVFVNAVRVERGALRHGDLVTIGETQFRFEADAAEAASR